MKCLHYCTESILTLDNGVDIYAGQVMFAQEYYDWDIVIDCTGGMFGGNYNRNMPKEFADLERQMIPVVSIPWADYAPPPVYFDFWINLVSKLKGEVVVCCEGGHGRTGTALACILLAARKVNSAQEAIEWVRKNHCREAIETTQQKQYIIDFSDHLGNNEYLSSEDIEKALAAESLDGSAQT